MAVGKKTVFKLKTAIFCLITMACFGSATLHAEPKPWIWSWDQPHWKNLDFEPYLETARHPHNSQWDESLWKPEDWVALSRNDGEKLMRDLYSAGIIRDQYTDNDIPVLEIGPTFYRLGGEDKRRVVRTVDYLYGITNARDHGMFYLYDWSTEEAIGIYTKHGLQLQ